MDELMHKLKVEIIEALNLEMTADEIKDDDPIFGEGLGLDSIDALELIVLLDKNYGIKITDEKQGKVAFRSVRTLAQYIKENTK